jgi:hypothetical protein
MMYSYIIVIPAAYYVALKTRHVNALLVLLGAVAISTSPYRPPVFNLLLDILPYYYPLLLTYVLWGTGIYLCLRASSKATSIPDSPESAVV